MIPSAYAADLSGSYGPGAALGGNTATIGKLVSPLIQNVIIITGVAAFLYIIFAGFSYITAGGDKQKTENAAQSLTYAIIGLVVVVAAYLITNILSGVFGFNIFSPES
jgi:hypothetical protein